MAASSPMARRPLPLAVWTLATLTGERLPDATAGADDVEATVLKDAKKDGGESVGAMLISDWRLGKTRVGRLVVALRSLTQIQLGLSPPLRMAHPPKLGAFSAHPVTSSLLSPVPSSFSPSSRHCSTANARQS